MPKYVKRYRRRSSRSIRRSKKAPVILGICGLVLLAVGLIVLAATLIGLSLRNEAEENQEQPTVDYITPEIQIQAPAADVREVNAAIYTFKQYAADFIYRDIFDLSVMLRDKEGYVGFNSEVAKTVGFDECDEKIDLSEEVRSIRLQGGYLCAYMYVAGFSDTTDMAEMIRAYEKQLIIEAAGSGIDEVLIFGIDVTRDNLYDVLEFLSDIRAKAGNTKIGIELDYDDVVSDDPDGYVAQMALRVCDFIALDASSVPCEENREALGLRGEQCDFYTAIEKIHYYTSKMQIRLTFDAGESALYKSIDECTYLNRQMHE